MGRKKTRRLTAEQFDAVMLLVSRMSVKRREAARLALVDGMTAQAVALRYGWQRTAVNNAETVVWQVHERYVQAKKVELESSPLPDGWVCRLVAAPGAMVRKLEVDAAKLKRGRPAGVKK
jgi:hypothetical protein